jgi:hypothetical protein
MSGRDLLHQVQALPAAERQQLLESLLDMRSPPAVERKMKAPDFAAHWKHMRALGLPKLDAAETKTFDQWLAGEA